MENVAKPELVPDLDSAPCVQQLHEEERLIEAMPVAYGHSSCL